jgi:Arc/MetJ-type ribon-helix-helix transcriptional regulator
MPTPKSAAPLTFELPASMIGKIARARRGRGLGSTSDVVRLAIGQFNFAAYQPAREPQVQISVRIAGKQRAALRHAANRKDGSVGELIRAALEALLDKPARRASRRG